MMYDDEEENLLKQKATRPIWAQIIRSRRTSGRGAQNDAADGVLLLARRTTRGEGGFVGRNRAPGWAIVTLRMLAERLAAYGMCRSAYYRRPQAGMADFYREMGELFRRRVASAQPPWRGQGAAGAGRGISMPRCAAGADRR